MRLECFVQDPFGEMKSMGEEDASFSDLQRFFRDSSCRVDKMTLKGCFLTISRNEGREVNVLTFPTRVEATDAYESMGQAIPYRFGHLRDYIGRF